MKAVILKGLCYMDHDVNIFKELTVGGLQNGGSGIFWMALKQ